MGLMDSLRKAEEQGREAARRSLEKARGSWEDAERRIRRKMRIHPGLLKKSKSRVAAAAPSSIGAKFGVKPTETVSSEPVIKPDEDAA